MLVKERMSHPVISVKPDVPIMEALRLMQRERIRRMPVIQDGKMIGIVSDKDLMHAAPSDATSLSVWEINYLISQIRVRDVMTKDVFSVHEDTPIEEAARIMADNKIGGLPVMADGGVVGLITETDLFKILLELMGARENGVRVTVVVPDHPGALGQLTQAIANVGGSFIAFGQFAGEDTTNRIVTFKVTGISEAQAREAVAPVVERIVDVRTCC
ncbi:MAG: CBS domain-containing protein [Anaerolineales bacterium]|nr:CBS domain-containing protein [Anaerolineales bacterium]MCB8954833.1 CBS domain-containing protein [Ardenticatenales bacterium]